MSSWGNNDNAANTPLWAAASVNLAPTRTNVTNLFDNTTMSNWDVVTGGGTEQLANVAIGVFGVDANEADVSSTHTGWVLRKAFEGGRAGRVQEEVLVATSSMFGDSDSTFANTIITITSQPSNNTAIHGNGNTVSFTVGASSSQGFPVTYVWQYNDGVSGWANASTNTQIFLSGTTSTTLVANAKLDSANTWKVRAIATSLDQTATSANATITIL